MSQLRIGVRLESLELPFRKALQEAGRLGAAGVQLDSVGDFLPQNLSETGRREIRYRLRSHGLELTALGCPLRFGLDVAENQQPRLDHIRQVMSLSYDLGCRIVIIQAGQIPEAEEDPRRLLIREALLNLGQHGDRCGAILALETGLEAGERLASFLDTLDTGALAVNFDPANLVMSKHPLIPAVLALAQRIVHVHAKDARQVSSNRTIQEVPLGHGDIDWLALLGAFEEVGYRGWLTVERETGDHRGADVAAGVAFLRRLVG